MDFDFNVILVPATLILGVIWLFDKLWLKRYQSESGSSVKLKVAKENLHSHKVLLEKALAENNINYESLDTLVLDHTTATQPVPADVKRIYNDYREAKRNVSLAQTDERHVEAPLLIRMAYDFFPVLLIVLVVRSFIIEPFNIPSSSMVPSLYTGDFIAVNKYAYGLRLPLTYNKIVDIGSPERGDVVVFRYPENPKIYYIKRVIGLPGDTVSFDSGKLLVNGSVVPSEHVNFIADDELTKQLHRPNAMLSETQAIELGQKEELMASYYQETLGEHTYLRRYLQDKNNYIPDPRFNSVINQHDTGWEVKVADGQYFVMGDNSNSSKDSRFWGFVPDKNLAGKAVYVWMHKKPGVNLPTFSRNGKID